MLTGWVAHLWTPQWAIATVLVALLFYPIAAFLYSGWPRRWEEISTILDDKAKQRYLIIFHNLNVDTDHARTRFKGLYFSLYGRKLFAIPMLLLGIIALVETYYIAGALLELVNPGKTSKDLQVSVAAMAGAYGAVAWYLIARMQQRNLSRGDVCRAAVQMAVAVIAGFAFSAFSNADLAPLMAFAVGFIPFQTLAELLRKQVRKQLPATADAEVSSEQITELTGIDAATAARIEDADITTVVQLAWCDPIDLTMRSNLQFIFVLDIVSQALAWVYLKGDLKALGKTGLRGAIEIRTMLTHLKSEDPDTRRSAEASRDEAGEIVHVKNVEALKRALDDIAEDPSTKFLELIWHSFIERLEQAAARGS
jgi:hypothetical protein